MNIKASRNKFIYEADDNLLMIHNALYQNLIAYNLESKSNTTNITPWLKCI